jgi:hypothetical protein
VYMWRGECLCMCISLGLVVCEWIRGMMRGWLGWWVSIQSPKPM